MMTALIVAWSANDFDRPFMIVSRRRRGTAVILGCYAHAPVRAKGEQKEK